MGMSFTKGGDLFITFGHGDMVLRKSVLEGEEMPAALLAYEGERASLTENGGKPGFLPYNGQTVMCMAFGDREAIVKVINKLKELRDDCWQENGEEFWQ